MTRDAQVDCALAEIYQRSKATEAALAAVQTHETAAAVFDRLVRAARPAHSRLLAQLPAACLPALIWPAQPCAALLALIPPPLPLPSPLMRPQNALEDSLSEVQEAGAHQHALRAAQAELKSVDVRYVRERVELLKRSAQKLLDSVLANPELTPEAIQARHARLLPPAAGA